MSDQDNTDHILDILTDPSVKDLARLFPDRTIVCTIPWGDLYERALCIEQAQRASGYKIDYMESDFLAIEAFEYDLYEIVMGHDIKNSDMDSELNENGDLEITVVFASPKDAMVFKMALP